MEGGYRNIREHFSYDHAKPVVLDAFASVGITPRPRVLRSRCGTRTAPEVLAKNLQTLAAGNAAGLTAQA